MAFGIPNIKTPFLDKDTGLVNRAWFIYLSNLLSAIGSGTVGTTTQVLHGGGLGYAQVNLQADVTNILLPANGGTGKNNGSNSISLGGSVTTAGPVRVSGSSSLLLRLSGNTDLQLPTTGAIVTSITIAGDVQGVGGSTVTTNINTNAVQNSQMAQMGSMTVKANNTGGTSNPTDVSGGQLPATQTNDSAASGLLGEYMSSTVTSGASIGLSTGVTANITSIVLTSGDWDVTGVVDYSFGNVTSYTNLIGGISTTSATLGAQDTSFDFETPAVVPTSASSPAWVCPVTRLSLASTTTTYLVTQATFTVSTLNAYGTIRARRAR